MFIKMKHHLTDVVLVLNVDVDSYKDFYVIGDSLAFSKYTFISKEVDGEKTSVREKDTIKFKSKEEVEYAREALFSNISNKAPYNKTLDLTIFDEMNKDESDGYRYVDIRDIANKFKTDSTMLRIVDVSNHSKSDESGEDNVDAEVEDDIEEIKDSTEKDEITLDKE